MKIFWSWQSDTPGKIGRFFVRDALQAAVNDLKQSLEVDEPTERESRDRIHLDHDRKGIPGSPDLARVILEKIENAAVFVADVTPVGVVHSTPHDIKADVVKKVINPNVAIELGYALGTLSDRSLLMVMNEFYGARKDLPFDLQAKSGPISFNLPPDANLATIERQFHALRGTLYEAIRLCLSTLPHPEQPSRPPYVPLAGKTDALYFAPSEILAAFGNPGEQEYRFDDERAAYLRLYPSYADQRQVGLAKLAEIFAAQKPCAMTETIGGVVARNRYGSIIIDPIAKSGIAGLTQGFPAGELWGLNSRLFRPFELNVGFPPQRTQVTIVPVVPLEKIYKRCLTNYLRIASGEFGLNLPLRS